MKGQSGNPKVPDLNPRGVEPPVTVTYRIRTQVPQPLNLIPRRSVHTHRHPVKIAIHSKRRRGRRMGLVPMLNRPERKHHPPPRSPPGHRSASPHSAHTQNPPPDLTSPPRLIRKVNPRSELLDSLWWNKHRSSLLLVAPIPNFTLLHSPFNLLSPLHNSLFAIQDSYFTLPSGEDSFQDTRTWGRIGDLAPSNCTWNL